VTLYRVIYYLDSAARTERGGVLYIPPQGAGRIDSPERTYDVLYAGSSPVGVCAEVFYRGSHRQQWNAGMLRPLPRGERRVLASYELSDRAPICDLNDPREMIRQGLGPPAIATRERRVTQAWASRIFSKHAFYGIAWWSHCDARWTTFGVWDRSAIASFGIAELSLTHPAIVEAAEIMDVRIQAA
jgi:hypothetical protein